MEKYFKEAGGLLLIVGLGSIGLALFASNYEMKLLTWIENWGQTVAWVIRGALVTVGAVLLFLGMRQGSTES